MDARAPTDGKQQRDSDGDEVDETPATSSTSRRKRTGGVCFYTGEPAAVLTSLLPFVRRL